MYVWFTPEKPTRMHNHLTHCRMDCAVACDDLMKCHSSEVLNNAWKRQTHHLSFLMPRVWLIKLARGSQ